MPEQHLSRRRVLSLAGAAAAVPALGACGSALGLSGGDADGEGGAVTVGLVVPQSGVYAPLGIDLQRGWDLWLAQHDNKLGGRTVTTVIADEGENPQRGVPTVQRVLQSDRVDVVVGLVNSATALGAAPLVAQAKKVLVVANAGAADITARASTRYVWRTSFQNAQVAAAVGPYLARENVPGGVFLIAPDYAAGTEARIGFKVAYEAAGGRIAGEAGPPFGSTEDFGPFLTQIAESGAGATFCFFAGGEAVRFVQQYARSGLKETVPLYGSGFLTEGGVLEAQAEAAVGVRTSLFYSDRLDNPANRAFVDSYQATYQTLPTCYSVSAWDAAAVLDRALAAATGLDGDSIAAAMERVGPIEDSPRGPWVFDGQTPRQTMYLRSVEAFGGRLSNAVIQPLGETSQL
ncbi:MAG TPA: ABC transporter substrate-binding protein [Pseudonocardia sp.]|nr:ABC transporter substrate-binding protein [Pseudonocardia sp.]